jgi:hypothetical protein
MMPVPDDPAVTAATDQARAAENDAASRLRAGYLLASAAEGAATGLPPPPVAESFGRARGPRAEVLARLEARLADQDVLMCEHAAAALAPGLARKKLRTPPLSALFWMSWHPDTIVCGPCAIQLPPATPEEDYRCDGCGTVYPPGTHLTSGSDVLRADAGEAARSGMLAPPLVCSYGLCDRCARASGVPVLRDR